MIIQRWKFFNKCDIFSFFSCKKIPRRPNVYLLEYNKTSIKADYENTLHIGYRQSNYVHFTVDLSLTKWRNFHLPHCNIGQ